MKGRIAVWTIVGIVVIAAVVFLISPCSRPLPSGKVNLDKVKAEAVQAETQIDRLTAKLASLPKPAAAPGDTGKAAFEADRLLNAAREKLGQVKVATDLKQAEAQLREAKQLVRDARRKVELETKGRVVSRGL